MIATIALVVSLVGTGVSVPLAIRADRRASESHRSGDVVWQLEVDPELDHWLTLRNTGRNTAHNVVVRSNIGVAVELLPDGDTVNPGEAATIQLAPEAKFELMYDSLRVTWSRYILGRPRTFEASVSTAQARAEVLARRRQQR